MEIVLATLFMAAVLSLVFLSDAGIRRAIHDWRARRKYAPTKQQREEWAERQARYKAEYEAANPEGPPVSKEEHAAFVAWLDGQERPALRLTPDPDREVGPDGTRLGGPVWLAVDQEWPESAGGNRLEFLAQLDFAELPALAGFPADGVLQFFIVNDNDYWGMDPDDPPAGETRILFRPNGAGEKRIGSPRPADPMEDFTPFVGDTVRDRGVALTAMPFVDRIPLEHWQVDEQFEGNHRRPGVDKWEDILQAQAESQPLTHHVGGYPCFVQSDFRDRDSCGDYDACLLRLTSDDYLMWGDVGEANFLIRSEDLAARDFSRSIFWWDCG